MERRGKCFSKITLILFVLFFLWVFLQFLAPVMLPENSVDDLTGLVAVSDNNQIIDDMVFPWNFVYAVGDRLCHQKAERSFFVNGNQMPFCSRCTALWLGIVVGLGFMLLYKLQLNEKFLFVILIGILPIAIDGLGQLFGLLESNNLVRFITGILAGGVCGIAIGVIIDEITVFPFFKNFMKRT